MIDRSANGPGPRAKRRPWWDGWRARGARGLARGLNGAGGRGPWRAYVVIIVFVTVVNGFNVLTLLHDDARSGRRFNLWERIGLEGSSGLAEIAACWIIYLALRRAPPGQSPWALTLLVHTSASLAFSVLHVGGMWLLRLALWATVGQDYVIKPADLLYEYRKDVIAYVILGGVFWLFARPASATPSEPASAATFDIQEGARTIRTPLAEILALRAAGNYVEFLLADGRRPLMRGSLRDMEAMLSPKGFLRTHRSWLINASCVAGFRSAGSGDFLIELRGGAEAPLSRRFKAVLSRLRAPGGAGGAPPS